MHRPGPDHRAILGALSTHGVASSQQLQGFTGKSQATVSRLLGSLSSDVVKFGRGRATRYGLPASIHGLPAQQPLWWIGEDGSPRRIGTLSLLAKDLVHVDSKLVAGDVLGGLPWYLSPLRAQGFLGRLLAQRLAASGVAADPEQWRLEAVLFAALQLHDAPGAIVLGDRAAEAGHPLVPLAPVPAAAALDGLAADVAATLPAGSSAGGEQPKFLAMLESGEHAIVKFTPPRGTPFGERWHDLLHAESLAAEVLGAHGVEVARCCVVESKARSFLVSQRFDRVGASGRRHVVPVGAVHQAFVAGAYGNWARSCEALARQGRLSAVDAARAQALLEFGRLIGNTDMHADNLGLRVRPEGLAKGRFELAPVYDMLPMRWRPDPATGGAASYAAFEPDPASAAGPARAPACAFWQRLAGHAPCSAGLRRVAAEMARRLE